MKYERKMKKTRHRRECRGGSGSKGGYKEVGREGEEEEEEYQQQLWEDGI